jgi:DNA-binding beta-propeller fold protein YncE
MRSIHSALRIVTLVASALAPACETSPPKEGPPGPSLYRGFQAHALRFGAADNPESVRLVPGTTSALVVSSKSRKLSLVHRDGDTLVLGRTATLFAEDASEAELTNTDVEPGGRWAAITRTLIDQDDEGRISRCAGELVFVTLDDSSEFGAILKRLEVGPMPDSVKITDDGRWAIVANEQDVVWGKCEGLEDIAPPSVSVIDLAGGPGAAKEVHRLELGPGQEPESVSVSSDSDLVVVTLQDSHQLLMFRISALAMEGALKVLDAPKNATGADAWPDGVTRFTAKDGSELFAVAGEANDTVSLLDGEGRFLRTVAIDDAHVPSSLPRLGAESWGPQFQPDSLTAFRRAEESYLAVSLKASGAVAILRVSVPEEAEVVSVVQLGLAPGAEAEQVGSEGIAASEDGAIWVANEEEGSVSLVLPLAQ